MLVSRGFPSARYNPKATTGLERLGKWRREVETESAREDLDGDSRCQRTLSISSRLMSIPESCTRVLQTHGHPHLENAEAGLELQYPRSQSVLWQVV